MYKFKFAIISTNDIKYVDSDKVASRFEKDELESVLEDYIKFEYNNDTLLDQISEIVQATENCHGSTYLCHEDESYRYELCYAIDDYNKNKNGIGTILCDNRCKITNNAIVLKYKINTNEPKLVDITLNDIIYIFRSKNIHKGIKIDVDSSVDEFQYFFNPLDWKKYDTINNIKFHEFKIYDKILMFFIELKPEKDQLNEISSMVYGKKILGTVYAALRLNNDDMTHVNVYCDIDKVTFKKLIDVMLEYNFGSSPKLADFTENNNFYIIINDEFNKYKKNYDINKEKFSKILSSKSLNELTLLKHNNA